MLSHKVHGASEVMTVTLKDVDDRSLWSVDIHPRLERWSRTIPSART
jgi:hypothetical protein